MASKGLENLHVQRQTAVKASAVLRKITFAPGNEDALDSSLFNKLLCVVETALITSTQPMCSVNVVTAGIQPAGGRYETAKSRKPRLYKDFKSCTIWSTTLTIKVPIPWTSKYNTQENRRKNVEGTHRFQRQRRTEIIGEYFAIRESPARTFRVRLTVRSLPWLIHVTYGCFGIVLWVVVPIINVRVPQNEDFLECSCSWSCRRLPKWPQTFDEKPRRGSFEGSILCRRS